MKCLAAKAVDKITNKIIVESIIQSLATKCDHVFTNIEESKDR